MERDHRGGVVRRNRIPIANPDRCSGSESRTSISELRRISLALAKDSALGYPSVTGRIACSQLASLFVSRSRHVVLSVRLDAGEDQETHKD